MLTEALAIDYVRNNIMGINTTYMDYKECAKYIVVQYIVGPTE